MKRPIAVTAGLLLDDHGERLGVVRDALPGMRFAAGAPTVYLRRPWDAAVRSLPGRPRGRRSSTQKVA